MHGMAPVMLEPRPAPTFTAFFAHSPVVRITPAPPWTPNSGMAEMSARAVFAFALLELAACRAQPQPSDENPAGSEDAAPPMADAAPGAGTHDAAIADRQADRAR